MLSPGDMLLLYTDGLIEARQEKELYGEERVIDVINQIWPASPREVIARLIAEAESFAGGNIKDDVAILTLRLKAE